jgi:hypothetical protein
LGGAPTNRHLKSASKVAVPFVVGGVTWALAVVDNDKRSLGLYSPIKGVGVQDVQPLVQFLQYDLRPIDGPELASGSDAGVLVLAYLEALLRGADRPHFHSQAAVLFRVRIAAELLASGP